MYLSATAVSVHYGQRKVLNDFSLRLGKGTVHTLIGPNGSGKSTALRTLAAMIPPQAGRVELHGKAITHIPRRAMARQLAFLPQHPVAPNDLTVAQLVRQARFAHVGLLGRYTAHDDEAVQQALAGTNMQPLATRLLHELSGGERQRAWISAALAQGANVLLLDEPTSYLDIGYQVEILELVHRLSRHQGVSVVMVLHDINQAMSISDEISLLSNGQLMFQGGPHALAQSGLVEQVFRVAGQFVDIDRARQQPPHFDVSLSFR